ncbi:DUF397 domain-containing protein [Amycolatopsis sp. lyj-109]|uniref:DUF397 domain-containing protein n=1 Tax=Amycolatopsis sp. lyj-109 TaxID=2789287 RepID=UPI003979842B
MARARTWIKSSHSEGQEHQTCVEVALTPEVTAVRDSKAPAAGHLTVPSTAWSALLSSLRH